MMMMIWIMMVRYIVIVIVIGHASVGSGMAIEPIQVSAARVCLGHHALNDQRTISADTSEGVREAVDAATAGSRLVLKRISMVVQNAMPCVRVDERDCYRGEHRMWKGGQEKGGQ